MGGGVAVGDGLGVGAGGGVGLEVFSTVIVDLAVAAPPEPVQVIVKVVVFEGAKVQLPDNFLETFDMIHEVALVDDQVSVVAPPMTTVVFEAASVTVGPAAKAGVENGIVEIDKKIENLLMIDGIGSPNFLITLYLKLQYRGPQIRTPNEPTQS